MCITIKRVIHNPTDGIAEMERSAPAHKNVFLIVLKSKSGEQKGRRTLPDLLVFSYAEPLPKNNSFRA